MSDPAIYSVLNNSDLFEQIKSSGYSTEKAIDLVNSDEISKQTRQNISKRCEATYNATTKILCSNTIDHFPTSTGQFLKFLSERTRDNNSQDFAYASQEIDLYCKSNREGDLAKLNKDVSILIKNQDILAKETIQKSADHLYKSGVQGKNGFLCKEVAKLKLAELPKKIQEQGCNDKKLDQDCIYLKTVEALYKDEIKANPNITFTELFNTQQEKPKLIRAFLGEDLTQKNELADKKEVDNDVKQSGQVNSSGSMAQNNFSGNAQAERSPASTSENNYSVATQESTNQQNVVNQNMRDLYNEVASRIQSGKAAEKKEQKRKLNLNPFKKKDYQVSDTVSQAISGSINDFPYNENFFGAEEVAMDDEYTPEANFFDPGPPNEDPEESAEQVLNKKYNRALAGMIPKEQAPKDVTHYEGKKLTKQLQIGSSAHDSEHITIKVNDVDKLEDMLAAISEGNFPNKDKLLEFLEKDEEGVFYIEAIKGQNFVVKLVKDEDGNLRIDRPSYAPKKNKKYENFYASVEKLVKSSLDNASKWIDLLKGIIKDNTYKRFLKDN